MSIELREYRKRLSLNGNLARTPSLNNGMQPYMAGRGVASTGLSNPNDVNFQFEFPRFGRLPGPPNSGSSVVNGTKQPTTSPTSTTQKMSSAGEKAQVSPLNQTLPYPSTNGSNAGLKQAALDGGDMSSLSGLFSPALLDSVGKSPSFEFISNGTNGSNGSRTSTDSNGQISNGQSTSHSSPSASSNSNHGASSSCGTSPEPSMQQSPVYGKPSDATLSTIGEENCANACSEGELTFCEQLNMACGNPNNPIPRTMSESSSGNIENPAFDIHGIDWFAQQNGNQFDPQLFGDYREPQDNILSADGFNDSFFNDAFTLPEFNTPFNLPPSPAASKKDLVAQIDEKQNEEEEVVPAEDRSQLLNCNTIWYAFSDIIILRLFPEFANMTVIRDRLQACPKVKEGEFDLDLLCKDLQKKAKCSETGAVVNESDFNKIMKSYVHEDTVGAHKA